MIDINNFYIEIMIQLFLIFSFLTIFYFLYVISIEREQFKSGINYVIDSIFDDIRSNLPFHKTILSNIKLNTELDTTKYPLIDKNNNNIFTMAMEILIAWFFAVMLLLLILFLLGIKIDLKGILMRNMLILLIIGVTEYLFLVLVGSKYRIIDANRIKYKIFDSIRRYTRFDV